MPGIVIAWYVTGTPVPEEVATEMKRYLFARQHPEDSGWGLHIEGDSSVFGTALNYITLRILGASAEDPRLVKARGKLHSLGGAVNAPHWGKFWMSVLGIMEWSAVNPVPPELWCYLYVLLILLLANFRLGFSRTGCPLLPGGGGSICVKYFFLCRTYGPGNIAIPLMISPAN